MKLYTTLALLTMFIMVSCYKEQMVFDDTPNRALELPLILELDGKRCGYDHGNTTLRFPIEQDSIADFSPFVVHQEFSKVFFEGKLLKNNSVNNLGPVKINESYKITIEANNQSQSFIITFTNLPLVQIVTANTIGKAGRTLSRIQVHYPEKNRTSESYYIGIKHRGRSSLQYDKKSFGFELKGSQNVNHDISGSFFDMQAKNDWILDAMWIDQARLRNKTAFEIWKSLNPSEHTTMRSEIVELYLNNEFVGLYGFNEDITPEHLNLQSHDAVLYKAVDWEDGATRFEIYDGNKPDQLYWDGWEQEYPRNNLSWSALEALRKLIVLESNSKFASQIETLVDMSNIIDYYILINLCSAADNNGKNTFLFRRNSSDKLKFIPWDLEGSFGLSWDGTKTGYLSPVSNRFFDRLIELNAGGFVDKLKVRWNNLRSSVLSNADLISRLNTHFSEIGHSDAVNLENKRWNSGIEYNNEQTYLLDWLDNRLIFLDDYFSHL